MEDNSKSFWTISCRLVVIIFIIRCLVSWSSICSMISNREIAICLYGVIGYVGESVAATTIIMALFNKYLWKLKAINIIVGRPTVLANRYEGTLTSDYDHIERSAVLEIEQTYLKVIVKMKTEESVSSSISSSISYINNEKQLIYIYLNEPKADIQDRSVMHYGTAMLRLSDANVISGNYYTGRNTKGSMKFEACD